ncbi:substrate-binding domain-containing protein [Paenibacillus methanolicus]|uniref:Ribose transport system substrate-binding protein n=1 Tax=Paenibacillus methanolicus TaxID=582686 RepID=A0A5S5CL57_9BACL|nr:substrate-binding domain-containing protein [Paenibacillus methanolicus]TYP79261.1 ribose transport system substrate-binding protein [Paenibacillus methanolicus]
MNRTWKRAAGMLLAAAALAAAAIWSGWLPSPAGGGREAQPRMIFVIKSVDPTIEFWQVLQDGIREAATEFGVRVEIVGPDNETDVEGQIRILEQAASARPDAIVLAATELNRLVPAARQAVEAGVELLTVDSGIEPDLASTMIATDNVAAGKAAGSELLSMLDRPSQVAIISFVRNSASQLDREEGVKSVLAAHPDIELLGTYYSEGYEQRAYETTLALLRAHPNLRGIVGLNEPSSVGAGRAIEEAGLVNQVKLIGFDSSDAEVRQLERGVMHATVIQKPFQMGYLSVKTALETLRGKRVPQRIDTGSVVVTKRNMYEEENQKLLFPFVRRQLP